MLIGALISLLVMGCVAAGWYFTRPAAAKNGDEDQAVQKQADAIFVNLESFTVNLADEGGERLAQISLVLELDSVDAKAKLTKNLPIVRRG